MIDNGCTDTNKDFVVVSLSIANMKPLTGVCIAVDRLAQNYFEFRGRPHDKNRQGWRSRNEPQDLLRQREEEEKKIFQSR